MPRLFVFLVLLSLLLSACAGSTPVASPESVVTDTPAATEIPPTMTDTATTAAEPGKTPTDSMPAMETTPTEPVNTGPVEYQIDPSESSVNYEVGETFFNENNRFSVAVGVTHGISGSVQLDPLNPQNTMLGTITVDISQFESDSGRRDDTIRDRFLESRRFPLATFVPTQITGLPEQYNTGEMLSFQVTGDLTVRETTRPTTFNVQASLNEGILAGQASTTLLMSEFGVGPIDTGVLGTEDEVKIIFNFVARPVN
jgi:polyisoprenoid-binding protein YceI